MRLVFDYILRCICFRNLSKKRTLAQYKPHYMYKKASDKLDEELDVIHLIKTLKKFRLFI